MQTANEVPKRPVVFDPTAVADPVRTHQNHQQHASKAYQTSRYNGFSQRETMAEAFRIIIRNLINAKEAYQARRVDEMCQINIKTLGIITLLASGLEDGALKDKDARAGALFMANLYNDVFVRLTNIAIAPKPLEEFDALIDKLRPVYRSWQPAMPSTDAASNPQSANNRI